MKNMKNIIKELDAAVANLEALSMSGKAVDIMAAAKVHIYTAQKIAREQIKMSGQNVSCMAATEAEEVTDDG